MQVLPKMLEAGKGTILLTGATAALRGKQKFALLSVPKFALRSLGQVLAREFGPQVSPWSAYTYHVADPASHAIGTCLLNVIILTIPVIRNTTCSTKLHRAAPSYMLNIYLRSTKCADYHVVQGIHVAHVIVDGIIDTPRRKQFAPDMKEDAALSTDAIAEVYWQLHTQHRSCWTQELDVRPFVETW